MTKSVETLDVDGEVMGDANVMEAMAATATARYAETLLRQNRSHAIESTFLDDFVDVTCDIDECRMRGEAVHEARGALEGVE